jgi:hypothetical protein
MLVGVKSIIGTLIDDTTTMKFFGRRVLFKRSRSDTVISKQLVNQTIAVNLH